MPRYRFRGFAPQIPASAYVADTASVIGRVVLGEETSVWAGAVIRADSEAITIGDGSNVQDNAVLHVDPGVPMTIGRNVTVGHQVMLHGCTIGDGSLIGIQSVVLNGARIGRHCLVGAGSLVTEGKSFPDGSLIVGRPARVVRALTEEQIAEIEKIAAHYVENARRFAAGFVRIS
jgi:carbonic anhydrase/acetyltransferase-like protein (isoleucine patch superfamily)